MYYVAIIAVAAAFMQFLLLPVYIRLKNRQRLIGIKIAVKGLMTFIAFCLALTAILVLYRRTGDIGNLVTETGMRTHVLLPVGLFVCMIADMVLCVNFPAGMFLFLLGHVCYSAYFIIIGGITWVSLPVFIGGVLGLSLGLLRHVRKDGNIFFLYTAYAVMITITLSTALVLPIKLREYGVLPAIAAILLVVSDIMLGLNKTRKAKVISDLMYLGYYFTGQFFLALSVFVPVMLGI